MRHPRSLAFSVLILVVAGCRGPEVANPLTGTSRYLCCNLYYDRTSITDVAYQVGTKIPFGTRVDIVRVRRNEVEFTPVGHPTIRLGYKYGDRTQPFDTYLSRLFVEEDPHRHLRRVPAKRVAAIEEGTVEPGMTKAQVLMARGLPPAHRTPSLDAPSWWYWQSRNRNLVVYFDGDKVARIGQ